MDDGSSNRSSARRDLVIAIIAVLGTFAIAASLDLHEVWMRWVSAHEQLEIDEIPFALAFTAVGFGWYAYRRWQEYFLEVEQRAAINARLAGEIDERSRAQGMLFEREEHLRGVIDNVADGIITTDESGIIESFSRAAESIFGYTGAEVLGRNVTMLMPAPDRTAHDEVLASYTRGGRSSILGVGPREVVAQRKDGNTFPMDLATSEMWLGDRRVFIASVRDVSERRRTREAVREKARLIGLLQKIAVAANEATSVEQPLQACLDAVCAHTGWPVGHVYILDTDGGGDLISTRLWHLDDPEQYESLRAITKTQNFAPGDGLPGRVLVSGRPASIADLHSDSNFLRAKLAPDIGVNCGFAFPVLIRRSVVAVLEFFSVDAMELNDEFLEVMQHIGTQLGRVFERKRAEETLRHTEMRLKAMADNSPAIICLKDIEGRYLLVNKQFEFVHGITQHAAGGKTSYEIFPEKKADATTSHDDEVIRSGRAVEREETVPTPDGERIYLKLKFPILPPHDSGPPVGIGMIGTDITERKHAEENMRAAMERAEFANRAKSEFLASISHELRTPLNAIIGFSEILKEQVFGPMGSDQYVEYAGDIHASGGHLLSVINDILDIARVESGETNLIEEKLDTHRIIDAAVGLVDHRADAGGIVLKIEIAKSLPGLLGDERKFKQILVNLLSNAIKFTPPPGTVRLTAKCGRDGGMIIVIRDTGIGMAAEDIPTALAPFGQIDSALERKYEGAGLGLPLAKTMVELHDGTLVIDSEPGVGTYVTVKFPPERTLSGSAAAA